MKKRKLFIALSIFYGLVALVMTHFYLEHRRDNPRKYTIVSLEEAKSRYDVAEGIKSGDGGWVVKKWEDGGIEKVLVEDLSELRAYKVGGLYPEGPLKAHDVQLAYLLAILFAGVKAFFSEALWGWIQRRFFQKTLSNAV